MILKTYGAGVIGVTVGVEVLVGVTVLVEVDVEVDVETPPPLVVVFVGVTDTVPVVAPTLITTVSDCPNAWDAVFASLQVPVRVPAFAGATKATETSAVWPGATATPMGVDFPLIPSPEIKMSW